MSDAAVIAALRKRRAELAGDIIITKSKLLKMKADLDSLDATLRQFDPTAVPDDIVAKTWRPPAEWSQRGEMKRRILAILRKANGQRLTSREVTLRFMHEKDLDMADLRLLRLMSKRIATALRGQREAGAVASDNAFGSWNVWWLAGDAGETEIGEGATFGVWGVGVRNRP